MVDNRCSPKPHIHTSDKSTSMPLICGGAMVVMSIVSTLGSFPACTCDTNPSTTCNSSNDTVPESSPSTCPATRQAGQPTRKACQGACKRWAKARSGGRPRHAARAVHKVPRSRKHARLRACFRHVREHTPNGRQYVWLQARLQERRAVVFGCSAQEKFERRVYGRR